MKPVIDAVAAVEHLALPLAGVVRAALVSTLTELESSAIEVHDGLNRCDESLANALLLSAFAENTNRGGQSKREAGESLESLERRYFGREVGHVRRHLNALMLDEIDYASPLVDIGCGGSRWKDQYWSRLPHVIGVEVNADALLDCRSRFADPRRYRLVFSSTGLTDLPDGIVSQVLSSSVIGYVAPAVARAHLRECWRLLAPGGRLIVARTNAFGAVNLFKGAVSFPRDSPGGVHVAYTAGGLRRLFAEVVPTARVRKLVRTGVHAPFVSMRQTQRAYAYRSVKALDRIVGRRLPLLSFHHLAVLEKPY